MEGFQIVGPTKPRFKSPDEIREDAFNRVTDEDIEHRVNKLMADANVAISKIDKALGRSTKYYSPSLSTPGQLSHRSSGRSVRTPDLSPPLEVEYRSGGRILSVQ